jgi:lysophospholipase L1-like esterase
MNFFCTVRIVCAFASAVLIARGAAAKDDYWVEPMRQVHARFTGTNGTLAQFGDSITITMAYWAPLEGTPKNMSAETKRAHSLVKSYLKPRCWRDWKGPQFGNNGSMTIRWAHQNVDQWLKRMNPEAVVIMFGSNDVGQMGVEEYERKTREVVRRCLTNGTVVILTAMPPRSSRMDESWQFVEAARTIAREERIPLINYFAEILKRRPEDWDGSLPKFKASPGDEYQVPTLIARDGVHPSNPSKYVNDFSDEALRTNGFSLRNYLTLLTYAEAIERVLRPAQK